MAKILHHNDDDGRCAAYIAKSYIFPYALFSPNDFIEYNYSGNLVKKYPEVILEHEKVCIVDISLSDEVFAFIKYVIDNGGEVLHIDHHATGIDYLNAHKEEIDTLFNEGKYTYFFKNGISGTMLCWIYANVFNDEDRKHPMLATFDFDEDDLRNKCCRVSNGKPVGENGTEITDRMIPGIPDVIRFIDDHDICKHKINETKSFTNGFMLQPNKHPLSQIWFDIISDADERSKNDLIKDILSQGDIIIRYRNIVDAKNLGNGFYVAINGFNVAFLNTCEGNSTIFQDMYDNSDAVCKYSFDGEKYWFTFYSKEIGGANCALLIDFLKNNYGAKYEFITGGGHIHAAGSTWRKNFLELFQCDRAAFSAKRKQIRIDKEVALEQQRIEEERRKLQEKADDLARLRAKIEANTPDEDDDGPSYDGI